MANINLVTALVLWAMAEDINSLYIPYRPFSRDSNLAIQKVFGRFVFISASLGAEPSGDFLNCPSSTASAGARLQFDLCCGSLLQLARGTKTDAECLSTVTGALLSVALKDFFIQHKPKDTDHVSHGLIPTQIRAMCRATSYHPCDSMRPANKSFQAPA